MITPLGLLLIPLGLLLFLFPRKYLVWLTIASIPFFFTVVISTPIVLVRPYQFLTFLLIARQLTDQSLSQYQKEKPFPFSGAAKLVVLFLGICYFSLLMPVFYAGKFNVLTVETSYKELELAVPLDISSSNFSQLFYPTFGVMLFLSLLFELRTLKQLNRAIVFMAYGGIAIALSGLFFQIALLRFGVPFLSNYFYIFTGNFDIKTILGRTDDYNTLGNLPRMFSLAGEPGYTALFLLLIFCFAVGCYFTEADFLRRRGFGWLVSIFVAITLVATFSTTAFLGMGILAVVILLLPFLGKSNVNFSSFGGKLAIAFPLLFMFSAGIIVLSYTLTGLSFIDYLVSNHFSKLAAETGSGVTRLQTVQYSFELFVESPFLGVGFGSHRTNSILTSLLSNVGLLGTLAFLGFNLKILGRTITTYRYTKNPELAAIAFSLLIGHSVLLPLLLVSKGFVGLQFGWFWLMLALMETSYQLYCQEQSDLPIANSDYLNSPLTSSR